MTFSPCLTCVLNSGLCFQEDSVGGSGVAASLEAVPRLARLLPVPQYTGPLLEGLVASVGGVDASLARVASGALVDVVAGRSSAAEQQSQRQQLLEKVAGCLLEMWGRHAKTARMAGPLMRCADLLATRAPELLEVRVAAEDAASAAGPVGAGNTIRAPVSASAAAIPTATVPFPDRLVALVRTETRQCTDVPRLLDASALLCHLLPCGNPCQASAVAGLLVLLVNRYPTVRRHTAEQLYLQLLSMEPEQLLGGAVATAEPGTGAPEPPGCVSAEDVERVQELLLGTSWDGDLDAVKATRDVLAGLLRVPVPAMKAAAAGAGGAAAASAGRVVRDENASYGALLADVSRGM